MSAIAVAGRTISIAGTRITVPDWSDLTDWTHSWDLADAEVVGGRVQAVADRHGGKPLRRLPGSFPLLGGDLNDSGPLPGPIYLEASPRFNGRPALVCDPFPVTGALFNVFAGLTPNVSPDGTTGAELSSNYFAAPSGYPQPYWVAVLGRIGLPDDPEGSDEDPAGIWDAAHGGPGTGPTIGRKIVGLGLPQWQVSNFGPGLQLVTVAHTATPDETVLILCHINGASSFLEVNWRDSNGTLQTLRQSGSQQPWNYLECFAGWVHGQYLTAAGIKLGVPDESELNGVRRWASYWIPRAGALPNEP